MKRFAMAGAILAVLLLPGTTFADKVVQHHNIRATIPSQTICGVEGSLTLKGVENFWPTGNSAHIDQTFLVNGHTIEFPFAGRQINHDPVFNNDGTITIDTEFVGLDELLKVDGRVVSHDAGRALETVVIDPVSGDVTMVGIAEAGHAPDLESGFAIFCGYVEAAAA